MTETKWLSVAEASLLATEMGLDRTPKTIRSWCRKGDVEARKQTTQAGDMWVMERDSLITKINFEIEVRDQKEQITSEPVQTSSDPFEPVRTSSDQYEHIHASGTHDTANFRGSDQIEQGANHRIIELEKEVRRLEFATEFNERLMLEFKKQYLGAQEQLKTLSRYIGHLESDLLRLGETPNTKFLEPLKPQSEKEADFAHAELVDDDATSPHPDQQSFYPG